MGVGEHRADDVDIISCRRATAAAAGNEQIVDTAANWSTLSQRTAGHPQSQPDHVGELVTAAAQLMHYLFTIKLTSKLRSTETFLYSTHLDCTLCAFGISLELKYWIWFVLCFSCTLYTVIAMSISFV